MSLNPVTRASNNQHKEISKPQKAVVGLIFLIGTILVIGAIIGHFTGLGVAGSAAMGATGGSAVLLAMIIRCSIRCCRQEVQSSDSD